jgi:arylsulfatase
VALFPAAHGELRHAPGHLIDIVPTVLELAHVKHERWQDRPVPAPPGKSLVPLFAKDGTVSHDSLWWCHEGNRALRVGDWKIVAAGKDAAWELYDLKTDRGESHNLAAEQPGKVRELEKLWTEQFEAFCALAKKDLPAAKPK